MLRLITLATAEGPRTGLLSNGKAYLSTRYRDTLEVLDDWAAAGAQLSAAGDVAARLAARADVPNPTLLAPLMPRNIFFAGANYRDHVAEMRERLGHALEDDPKGKGLKPWLSMKATGATVVGPDARVARPDNSPMLDWELELAVVIGRRARHVKAEHALDVVAGYTIANDLSAREHVGRDAMPLGSPFKWDWIGQKSFDGSCPLGPAITPAAAIGDPMNLDMKLWVNGELMQSSNTAQMIYSIQEQIEFLSSRMTLQPGDVILTGTPAGVGVARNRFLQPGDVVRHWIDQLGEFNITIE